jgi:hypothetical protein
MKMMDKREFICILVVVILFILISAFAAYEGGYIHGTQRVNDYDRKVNKIELNVRDLSGRVVAHDAIIKNLPMAKK